MKSNAQRLLELGIRGVGRGFRTGDWSPTDVAEAVLARTAVTEPTIHAWVMVDDRGALEGAGLAEAELRAGVDRGLLHGIPIGVKDIFDVAGWPTRCGSSARRESPPAMRDARSIAKLREAGAVLLGKTVTQEFAAGVVSSPARNPWDPDRIPGGSSGGSAAAVALGNCFGAMGSDTGGSIRIPAAACGVVGFKPTFGEIDVEGVFPLSWSQDTVGPIARTVDDAWILWRALVGENTAAEGVHGEATSDLAGIRIGVPRPFFLDAVQPDVLTSVEDSIAHLEGVGATIIESSWEDAAAARASAFIMNRVETAAVHEDVAIESPETFAQYGKDLRLRVAAGRTIPATVYVAATHARASVRGSMQSFFAEHQLDALLVPTLPTTAVDAIRLEITGTGRDESLGAGWTRLTMPFNATGQPVLTVPAGFDRLGLPIGVQLAGAPGREAVLFRIGSAMERASLIKSVQPPLLDQLGLSSQTEKVE